jgi:methionyl-tRNA formyltransferase
LQKKVAQHLKETILEIVAALKNPVYREQADDQSTYYSLPKSPVLINWQWSASEVSKQSRAMYPWGNLMIRYFGFTLLLGPGFVLNSNSQQCKKAGAFLGWAKLGQPLFCVGDDEQQILFKGIDIKGYPRWISTFLLLLLLRKGKRLNSH